MGGLGRVGLCCFALPLGGGALRCTKYSRSWESKETEKKSQKNFQRENLQSCSPGTGDFDNCRVPPKWLWVENTGYLKDPGLVRGKIDPTHSPTWSLPLGFFRSPEVTEIGRQAFFRCTGLEQLVIPDSVSWVRH